MAFIFPILLLLLINIWVFMPFFGLGLFGDDWLAIFRYSYYLDEPKHLGPYSTEYFNHFKYLLNAYGSQEMIMAFLYKAFGEGSSIYFILSYILRVGAGGAIYFPAFYITKNKLAAWFAVFFFLFSTTGLEASSWVFNMPSYLAIIFFNFLLYFYLRFHMEKKLKYLLLSYLFFTLAFISTPIRAHGLIPFIIFLEIVFLVIGRHWNLLKFSLFRIVGFLLIFLLIYSLGFKESISGTGTGGLSMGFNSIINLLSANRFDFLFYPITTVGSMLLPDSLAPNFGIISSYVFLVLIGFCFLITLFAIVLFSKSQMLKKVGILLALGWIIISFLYPWWTNPDFIYLTTHRYLIISSTGMSLLLGIMVALGKNSKTIFPLLIIGTIFLLIHAFSTKSYIEKQYNNHNRKLVGKIWSQIPYIPEIGKNAKPLVFYFEGDQTNGEILHNVITFGFPFHIALIYGLSEEDKLPVTMDSWEEVVSSVKDGKSFIKHYGKAIDPIPIDNIYVFKLEGKDNLINLTETARAKLKQIK